MAKRSNASILKSKGLIPKDWDLRNLTDYKKRIIRKREKEYSELIKNPQAFKVAKVAKATGGLLERAGYRYVNGRAVIPNKGAKVKIKGDKLIFDKSDRTETVYLMSGKNFLRKIAREVEKEETWGETLGEDEYWALKIGDNNTFISSWQKGLGNLMNYAKDIDFNDEDAKNYVSLVKIKFKRK